MTFLVLYRNQYKNLKKDKRKKTRVFQLFFLLLSGIWGAHATGTEDAYGEAFYNRIKGLSDNAEQFDSSHYYYQRLVPPVESNIVHPTSSADLSITCFIRNESGETINLASSLEHPSTYRNGEYCVTITRDRGSISKVTLNTREIDLTKFEKDSKRNIMQASFDNLDDLRQKVRAGNIYGYSQETWFDESTGISFTVQNNIRKNIKIRSMALCFSEEERTTDIYFDVCSKENESEFFDPIKKSITTLHDELPAPSNFPKDIYVIKNGDTISRLKKEGKFREIFKAGSNVRSLWIENSSFQKRVKNNRIVYISAQLPSQYRYGEPDIDFKGLLIEGNVVKGQYFILDGEIESSYSKTYLYKKADKQLFCVKANKGKIKYTDSTDLEWLGSAENTIKYLTKDRPLPGASQTGSHNIEGFYRINGTQIGQRQNWLIFKDETNPSALFSTEFPCISVSDFSPDTFKNDQKKEEEIAFIDFLSVWDHVQSLSLEFNVEVTKQFNGEARGGAGGILNNSNDEVKIKRFFEFLQELKPEKVSIIKLPHVDFNVWSSRMSNSTWHSESIVTLSEKGSIKFLDDFFEHLGKFSKLEKVDFEFLYPIQRSSWYRTNGRMHYNIADPTISGLKKLFSSLTKIKVLKMTYPTYDMIKEDSVLINHINKLHLHLYHIPHGDEALKKTIKTNLSGGQVTFDEDPPSSGCVIS